MKIKANNNPFISKKMRDVFRRRRRLASGILGLGGIVGAVILFFVVFNYGGYLYKSGQTQHFKQMLSDMASFDFSFVKNYMKGQTAELDDVKIDMKFKHMLRLQYLREQAVKSKYIDNIYKDEEFPAQLTFNGKTHDVKLSLTGKVSRTHLGNPSKWSFQIKVKGDDTVEGMKRFGVLVPTARGNLTDWLSFELQKDMGMLGLRVNYVNVTINGKSSGVFYMEERFDKHLVENNRLREGILLKLDKEVLPYKESKLMADPAWRAQVLLLKHMWQDVMAGNLPPEKFFDMKKMAQVLVISDLMNNRHPLSRANLRFYFNPVTTLVEPIAREFEDIGKSDPATMNMFLEEPDLYSRQFWLSQETIIGMVHENEEFQRHYIRESARVSQKKFLDEFFSRNEEKLDAIIDKLYRTWPYYKLPQEIMYANQDYIRSVLFPETPQLEAGFQGVDNRKLSVHVRNLQDLPLEISYISWQDRRFYPEKPLVLDAEFRTGKLGGQSLGFQLPEGVSWSDEMLADLKVHYNLLGLEPGGQSIPLSSQVVTHVRDELGEDLSQKANYTSFDFISEKENGTLAIPAGKWKIAKDLVIPSGKSLMIQAGAQIDLVKGAGIISYSPIHAMGDEVKPVELISSDATSKGIAVLQTMQRSSFSYTNFNSLSNAPAGNSGLKGGLSFQESPVNFIACNFAYSRQGGAMLHMYRSDFLIDESVFENMKADVVVSDFCTGTIRESSFVNVGGNGLDLIGSKVELSNIFMKEIGAKGIIAGQGTRLSAQWIDIRNADAGLVGINQSEVTLSDMQILNSRIGIALLAEKENAGTNVKRLLTQQVEIPYLVEENASLRVDGKLQPATKKNVKELLAGPSGPVQQ